MKLTVIALLFSTFAMAQVPEIVLAPLEHLYVPTGFDSNDSAEVVVTGAFPNACFSRNDVDVKINDTTINIVITAIAPDASKKAGRACPDMLVPFKEVITLGNLQGGEYDIKVNSLAVAPLTDKIKIGEASSSAIDDHIYSAVEYVQQIDKENFVLHGWRYSNCIELDKVQVVSNQKDTLSVLPIMKQLTDFCPMKMMPTAYPFKANFSTMKILQPLLHVRTMDGKSVNSVVNLAE